VISAAPHRAAGDTVVHAPHAAPGASNVEARLDNGVSGPFGYQGRPGTGSQARLLVCSVGTPWRVRVQIAVHRTEPVRTQREGLCGVGESWGRLCLIPRLGAASPPHPSGPQSSHLDGSASTEKGPFTCTVFCLFSNVP
jgi:hypothetical protein